MTYLYVFLYLVLLVGLLTFVYGSLRAAPWFPTRAFDVDRVLKLANVKKGEKMYDLGCGDGRLVCAFAKRGVEAHGYEVSLFPLMLALFRRMFLNKDSKFAKFSYRDFWKMELKDADLVYFFLMPKVYPRLKSKFEKELKKGALVIAYVWPIEGWTPLKVDEMVGRSKLYLYKM